MKKLLLLGLLCVCWALGARGQAAAVPFKGANVLVIQTPDSAAAALRKLAQCFVAAGYNVDKLDTDLLYLTTASSAKGQLTPAGFAYRATAADRVGGALISLSGGYTVQAGLRSMYDTMSWTPSKMWQGRVCFDEAQRVAISYPGGIITYRQDKIN